MGIKSGIDMVEIDRIKDTLDRNSRAFINKVYTPLEVACCESRKKAMVQSLAARFCAKEAVSKALGTGISHGISFKDIEIINDESGKPYINLYGEARRIFESLGGKAIEVSLTHTRLYAAAFVVIETQEKKDEQYV